MESKPRKRGRGVARQEIIRAATQLFARRGYDGTGLRDIAALANADVSLIYRSVGSKGELFKIAALEPIHDFISAMIDRWTERGQDMSNEDIIRLFISELYDLLKDNREIVLALVSAGAFSADLNPDGNNHPLSAELDRLVAMAVKEAGERDLRHIDMDLALRYLLGVVLAMVVLDDVIFPPGRRRPSRKRLVDTMGSFGIAGVRATLRAPRRVGSPQPADGSIEEPSDTPAGKERG